ncbi:MAG: transposase [Propionivibrio sp.]
MKPEQPDEMTNDWRGIPMAAMRTRRAQFLAEAERLFPWQDWENLIEVHYPKRGRGRPPYPLRPLLRLYLLRQWFALSDQAAQEVAVDSMAVRQFMGLGLVWGGTGNTVPDETTILNFRRLVERCGLAEQIAAEVVECLGRQGWRIRRGESAEPAFVASRIIGHNADTISLPQRGRSV